VTAVKNVRIAAVIGENGKLIKEGDRSSIPKYIAFEVSEEEAEFLAAAKGEGRLEIAVIPES
jgi:Flp pilus assembly protein CpaB